MQRTCLLHYSLIEASIWIDRELSVRWKKGHQEEEYGGGNRQARTQNHYIDGYSIFPL